jgi:CheY-like chemotaxis protein
MTRVLVVDDNRENVELLVFLLRVFGHEPIAASSGAVAVEIAAREPIDVVLLDIQMPEMNGLETARALQALPSMADVPLVAVTAIAMPGDRELILDAGFTGYIAKPIDVDRLPGQIATFLPPGLDRQ